MMNTNIRRKEDIEPKSTYNQNYEKAKHRYDHLAGVKWYMWRKEWVRPYESIFSILRNFCKVNALDGNDILRLFGLHQSNTGHYNNSLICISDIWLGYEAIRPLLDVILPDDYYNHVKAFATDCEALNTVLTDFQFAYCPECMKENYHSVLHNITNMKCCPFHKVPLIHTDISYRTGCIRYSSSSEDIMNVKDCILPCERVVDVKFYTIDNEYDVFVPIARRYHNNGIRYIYSDMNKPIEGIKPDKIIEVPISTKSAIEFDAEFTHWFEDEQKMCHDLIYESEKNRFKIEHLHPNCCDEGPRARPNYHYIELYLYYKFRESAKESGLYEFYKANPKLMPDIYRHDFEVTPNDKELICASFIAAAVGSMYWYDAFDSDWILHPDGGANSNSRRTVDIHLSYLESDLFRFYNEMEEHVFTQVLLAILEDQYNYMYEQFFKKVEILGKCKAYYIYQGLILPEYYITHKDGDDHYKVYRYDKEQLFGTNSN